jgi:hypothetical protein
MGRLVGVQMATSHDFNSAIFWLVVLVVGALLMSSFWL